MRTDRGRRTFYAAGWGISAGVMLVTSRLWHLHLREVEQRAEEAERTRDEAARSRAMEERLRIARELHDSLTHSISVICVQAGVAVHLARKRGEEVPPALLAIREAGADAARELRTTLSVLRRQEDGDCSGLGQLDSLLARARTAGLPVTVTVTGAQRVLPPDVDQAAYRIVQEALTNVSRHAGRACASVHLHYLPDALSVQVDDDGAGTGTSTGPRPAGPGLGLVGMRERVTALGGRLHAGPRDGGGFGVHAELPARTPSWIRILLADDQALIRSGIRSLLEAEDDIEVVAEAADGRQAVKMAAEHRPDIALMDIQMLSPAVTRRLISEFVARPPDAIAAAGMESLTNREREVVALVAHGLSNDDIAEAMVLSPTTAKTHVSRAMIKLGARDRAQLVVFAYQAGLVTPRAAG